MKRDKYVRSSINTFGVSIKNEPLEDFEISSNVRLYPNMYNAYNNFSSEYKIPFDNFILTNGCESALRIAILAIRPKKLIIEYPTWGRVPVECEALGIPYDFNKYLYNDGIFIPSKEVSDDLYTTDTYNNLFKHDNMIGHRRIIMDETYTSNMLFSNNRKYNKNIITIGSFSKTVGAGLRLGYCIFSNEWSHKFNLLREQYISASACKWLNNPIMPLQNLYDLNIPNRIVTRHNVYTTVKAKTLPIPHKHFVVSNTDFCRFGNIPDMSILEREIQYGSSI